ncbi:hypothetical protein [Clostridium tertium]|uniref:hypothetical protein n=2 Tax=Clostridium tertium TaxID=1559 RepID=UPI00189C62C0|nr:hypothetical protein [Clostridium tertium]
MIKLHYIVLDVIIYGGMMGSINYNNEYELTKDEDIIKNNYMNYNKSSISEIKEFLLDQVIDVVRIAKENNNNIGENLRVIIPNDCEDAIKDGVLKFMTSKEGEILPNIVDDKNKIIRKIRLKELPNDKKENLEEITVNKKLELIKEQLEYMTELIEGIQTDIKNDRYGIIKGALTTYKQSLIEKDEARKKDLQTEVQVEINRAIGQMQESLNQGIDYFKEWDNIDGIKRFIKSVKYNNLSINNKLKYICLDYYYINKGINVMVEMKLEQGMRIDEIKEFLKTYKDYERLICDANIKSWLPVSNGNNNWQREIIMNCEKDKNYIEIDFDIKTLLEKREYYGDKM